MGRCVLCGSFSADRCIPVISNDCGDEESLAVCGRCYQILHGCPRSLFKRPYVVYALVDPLGGADGVFYIGKAKNRYGERKGNIRLQRHLMDAKVARRDGYVNARNGRILEILDRGDRPIYRILDYYESEIEAYTGEMEMIKKIGLENLTNEVEGDLSVGANLAEFSKTVSRLQHHAKMIKQALGGQRNIL